MLMDLSIFLILFLFFSRNTFSSYVEVFGSSDTNSANVLHITDDGDVVVFGETTGYDTASGGLFISKLHKRGSLIWTKVLDGPNTESYSRSIARTNDGGFIIVGSSDSRAFGSYDLVICKFHSNDTIHWIKYIDTGDNDEIGHMIDQTSDGGYIVVGETNHRVLVVKVDEDGISEWSKSIGVGSATDPHIGFSVKETIDGGFIVTGSTTGIIGHIDAYSDLLLLKLNHDGTHNFTKTLGIAGSDDVGREILVTSDGGYLVAGFTKACETQHSGLGMNSILMVKFSSSGSLVSTVIFGETGNDKVWRFTPTRDGKHVLLAGTTFSYGGKDGLFAKTLMNGSLVWMAVIENDEGMSDVRMSEDGEAMLVGSAGYFSLGASGAIFVQVEHVDDSGPEGCMVSTVSPAVLLNCNELELMEHGIGGSWLINDIVTLTEGDFTDVNLIDVNASDVGLVARCKTCYGDEVDFGKACSYHGECVYADTCFCYEDYFGDFCNITSCDGVYSNNTGSVCHGNGQCIFPETCQCDYGYFSTDTNCRDWYCGNILHSALDKVCSARGNCTKPNTCLCLENYYGEECEVTTCKGIFSNMTDEVCNGNGECQEFESCQCSSGFVSSETYCSDWYCFGKRSSDSMVCSGRGRCEKSGICVCEKSYSGNDCGVWECFGVKNENEDEVCSGNGRCVTPDKCKCRGNYGKKDCSYNNDLAAGLGVGLGLSIPTLGLLIALLVILCCALVCLIMVFVCCVICGLIVLMFTQLRAQKKSIQRFGQLRGFDMLLKEQELEDTGEMANLKIKKSLFSVEMDDIRTVKILGEGGSSSVVFKAEWAGKNVAFKCFKTRTLMASQDKFDEFEREVEILSSLAHPHIIQFFGACLKPPRVGILMEFCPKGELLEFVMKFRVEYLNAYPIPEKIRLLIEICSALEYIHSKNVIHRDLKCENVLISESSSAKLMDFGLSRAVDRMSQQKTTRIGTNIYMAPELVLSETYNEKCDVFSFGIMMFVLLTESEKPYGEGVDTFQIELKVANDPNYRPDLNNLKLPEMMEKWLKTVVRNCFQHNSEDRYSCKEIRGILEKGDTTGVLEKMKGSKNNYVNNEKTISITFEEFERMKKRIVDLEEENKILRGN